MNYDEQFYAGTESEEIIIGCALIDHNCVFLMMEQIKEEHFESQLNADIFRSIRDMFDEGIRPDLFLVLEKTKTEFLNRKDLKSYLLKLCEAIPTISNMETHCKIVLDKYYKKRMRDVGYQLVRDEYSSAGEMLELTEGQIADIRSTQESTGLVKVSSFTKNILNEISETQRRGCQIKGILTGFSQIDNMITGLKRTDLIVVAARPGVGKSSFAVNIGQKIAFDDKEKGSVCVFSLEMGKEQLIERVIASKARVKLKSIDNGKICNDEMMRLSANFDVLNTTNFYIDDTAGITVGKIKARLKQVTPTPCVAIIDYLQLITPSKNHGNRVQEVSEITRDLKIMAKELKIPVILISQLSRDNEKRSDKRPLLSDLRDSGSIEQDADIVMFLYRENYYDKIHQEIEDAECIISKNRHGGVGVVDLLWEGEYTLFTQKYTETVIETTEELEDGASFDTDF